MDRDLLSMLAGGALSLGCAYVPGVRERFCRMDGVHKRLVMLGLLALCALGVLGLSCVTVGAAGESAAQTLGWSASCDRLGALALARALVLALVSNQSAYLLGVRCREE